MKRFINILLTAASAAVLFSCTHEYSFQTASYVIMEESAYTVKEDVGVVRIPVSAYNSDGLTGSVYFKVNDGTAVQGTDFTVEPANGVLSFNGNGTQYIEVSVIEHAGVLTGNLKCSVELTSASGDINQIGGAYSASIEIQDNDVVVDWNYVAGVWNAQDYNAGAVDGGVYKVTITKKGDNTLTLNNLWGGGVDLVGTIDFDLDSNTATMTFETKQLVFDATDYGYGEMILIGYNPETGNWSYSIPAYATVTSGGIVIGPWNMVITAGQYSGYLYGTSYTTVLTK